MLGVCLNFRQKNYGSKLQALATIKTFELLGVEYEIIQYNKRTAKFLLKSIPRFFNTVFLHDRYDQIQKFIEFRRHPEIKQDVDLRNQCFDSYDEQFEKFLSPKFASYDVLKRECPQRYDRVITCSDQLWSPSALGSGFYNLMFAPDDMLKVSWASSFGVSQIPWYQKKRTKEYLERIQRISVRENRGSEIVKELTGKSVPVLMDPVFIFNQNEWEKLIPHVEPEWENYMFCYFLGDNPVHREMAKQIADKKGLKIVTLRHLDRYVPSDEQFGDIVPYDVGPERFINILRNASFVCTDSFHGASFSVIFQKQFIVFDRYNNHSTNSKNSRIDSLCENLMLQDRRVNSFEKLARAAESNIDYSLIEEKLALFSKETMTYLNEALKS